MGTLRCGLGKTAEEHLVSGLPLTRLDAMVLFGAQNLCDVVVNMRKWGRKTKSERVPYAKTLVWLNKLAQVVPSRELPVSKIRIIEYQPQR